MLQSFFFFFTAKWSFEESLQAVAGTNSKQANHSEFSSYSRVTPLLESYSNLQILAIPPFHSWLLEHCFNTTNWKEDNISTMDTSHRQYFNLWEANLPNCWSKWGPTTAPLVVAQNSCCQWRTPTLYHTGAESSLTACFFASHQHLRLFSRGSEWDSNGHFSSTYFSHFLLESEGELWTTETEWSLSLTYHGEPLHQ